MLEGLKTWLQSMNDAWASDVGINGAGASAEEAAVHVVSDDE